MSTNDDSRGHVQREDHPPLVALGFVPIYSAVPEANIHLISLSPRPVGVWTHFHMNRTIPCVGKPTGCICAIVQLRRVWKGYLASWDPLLSRVCLAEVTYDCYRNCAELFNRPDSNVRGRAFMMFRNGNRRNSPVRLTFGARVPNMEDRLPPEPDVMRILRRIWGVPE